MNSDDRADEEFQRAILAAVQTLVFAIAIIGGLMVDYTMEQQEICNGKNEVRAEG